MAKKKKALTLASRSLVSENTNVSCENLVLATTSTPPHSVLLPLSASALVDNSKTRNVVLWWWDRASKWRLEWAWALDRRC